MALFNIFHLDIYTYIVALVTFIVTYIVYERLDKKFRNLPPGPIRLPVIGTMYMHSGTVEGTRVAPKYFGDVFVVYGGPFCAAILNTYESIKQTAVANAKECSDRGVQHSFCTRAMNPRLKGILQSNFHERLRHNRNSSLTILRNLGVGRSNMEEKMLEETESLVDILRETNGQAFDPWHMLTCSVANVILYIMLNKRHHHDDPEFLKLVEYTDDFVASGKHMEIIDAINFLRFLPPYKTTFSKVMAANKGMCDYMWKYAKDRVESLQAGDDSDFVDCWINKVNDSKDEEDGFDKEDFLYILRDFLIAGTETTATSLKWTIIHMANYPHIQAKVHEEIDRVVGKEKSIHLNDRNNLPYLEALVQEVQRFNTILPLGLPHFNSADTKAGNFDIPAGTFFEFNLHSVHMNKETFGDPLAFRPDRFIDSDGKFIKHPNVIPFAIGKRSCLGELLARQELFVFTAALVQKFKFSPPEGVEKIDDQGVLGFTNCPKRFKIRAFAR